MKDGMTYEEYIDFVNYLFLQQLVDFEFFENADVGSSADALEIIGEAT